MPMLKCMKHKQRFFSSVIIIMVLSLCVHGETISYTVRKGDTLYSISKRYDISVSDITRLNNIGTSIYLGQKIRIPSSDEALKTEEKTEKKLFFKNYEVKKGDTLYSISMQHGITLDVLCESNNLTKNDPAIFIGQIIKLPVSAERVEEDTVSKTDFYEVQKGDTLYRIAKNHGMNIDALRSLNNLTATSVLKVGQRLSVSFISDKPLPPGEVVTIGDPRKYSSKKGNIHLVWPVQATAVAYVSGKISGVAITASASQEKVSAIREGTVMFSGSYRGYGEVIFIQSADGYIYVYSGLQSLSVKKGDAIDYDQKLGIVGLDSYTKKPVMNLMVFKNDRPVDPEKAPRG